MGYFGEPSSGLHLATGIHIFTCEREEVSFSTLRKKNATMVVDIGWAEYFVFASVLAISMGIGIYYGFFGTKQKSTKEYLQANRSMSSFPVALSMICSAVSAITLIANPVEIYLYGTQFVLVILCFIPFNLSLAYLYIPVYFNLNVNSAYDYIELRFDTTVRLIVSILAVVHVVVSMAIAIYAPSLAIEQITSISTDISTAVIYFVCIFYSTLGGLKGVLWADAIQAFIMLASLAAIAIKGVSDLGGLSIVFDRAWDGNRMELFNFDPDPRVRHTVWTAVVAGYFFWLPSYAATQLQVQRFLSMPTIHRARKALVINFIGLTLIVGLCFFTGLVMYAKYHDCDPIANGEVEKTDQLVPLFAAETVKGVDGLLGLFIAGLTSASMSSLSSGLTALASITTYDYVNKLFPNLSDTKLSTISKVNTFILGMVSYSFVYVIKTMGSILPATSSFLGILLGPTLGLFTLGMFYPMANSKGVIYGLASTFLLMILFISGTLVYPSDEFPNQKLTLETYGCSLSNFSSTTTLSSMSLDRAQSDWKNDDDSFLIQILSISYLWYSGLGCILMVILGGIFSHIFNYIGTVPAEPIDSYCISPPLLRLWKKLLPTETYHKWISHKSDRKSSIDDSGISIANEML